ncbi:MAG: CBS domain-containing protein [Planctomycetota bacterium]|jgi:CBS domain-containing protein
MNVHDVMTRNAATVGQYTSLTDACAMMKERDIGLLPVTDGGRTIGVVTDRDIVVRGLAAGKDPSQTPVSEVMSRPPVSCGPGDSVEAAAQLMEARGIRRLLVLGEGAELMGVVSLGDIASRAASPELAGEVLASVTGELAEVR